MLVPCLVFIFLSFQSFNCSPISEDIGNAIDDIEDSAVLRARYTTPDEESGQNVEAWNRSSGINPEELGNYLEGDIMLEPLSLSRNGISDETRRWDNAVIPYVIDFGFKENEVNLIKKAMDIYHKNTCIRFVPKKSLNTQRNFILITNGNQGCFSYIGKRTGKQRLNLQSPGCTTLIGTVLHELMHAAGFYHEQSRADRDDYVTINFKNVQTRAEENFEKASANSTDDFGVSYDYDSVMHYSKTAFSKNGKDTITPKEPKKAKNLGQRKGFSRKDLIKLNAMYKCPDIPADFTTKSPE